MLRTDTCSYCNESKGYKNIGKSQNVSVCNSCGATFDASYVYDEIYRNHKATPDQDTIRDIGV